MSKISMYATRTEIRNYGDEHGIPFAHINLAQIYALYTFAEWTRSQIADHLDYAPSTVSTKRSKMWEFSDLAEMLFGENEEEINVVIETPTEPKILFRNFKDGRPSVPMEFMPNCGENLKNEEAVYFFKFFNAKALEFNKIGTSAKDVVGRLRQEIGEYSKKFDIRKVEIHRIRPCGNIPAEGAESALRAELIRQYPTAFRKNDRFFGVDIAPEVFDEIVSRFFG
jgi:hypothetical protein